MDVKQIDNETISLKAIVVRYLRQWKLFVIAGLVSIIPAVLYLVYFPKTYEILSVIQIQDNKDSGSASFGLGEAAGLMKSFGLGGGGNGVINIDDELAILSSNELLSKVVLDLGLNVIYYKPYAYKYKLYDNTPLKITMDTLTANRLEDGIELLVTVAKDGKVKVKTEVLKNKKTFEYSSLPAVIKMDQGDFVLDYANESSKNSSIDMKMQIQPVSWIAEELSESLVIEEYSKNASVIELLCQDYEKQRGKDLLNVLIEKYNNDAETIKERDAQKTISFLDERLALVTTDLSNVERRIEEYKIKNKLTDVEYDIQFYVEQMKDLQTKLIELEAQVHVVALLDAYVKDPKNKYNLVPSLLSAQEGEKGSPITSYNEALLERSRVIQNSSLNNPLVSTLTQQADQLRESVFLSIDNARQSLALAKKDLESKEKMILDKMGSVPTQEREYIDFKRQQEIFQGVYLILLQKREDAALSIGQKKDRARVVNAAFVKQSPVGPRKLYAAIGMLVFTLIIPVLYLFCKEQIRVLRDEYKRTK